MYYVSVVLKGGFANRLFMLHTAIAYAKRTKRKFILKKELIVDNAHEDNSITMNSLEKIFSKFIYQINQDIRWRKIYDPDANAYIYNKIPDYPNESIILDGYFQSQKYFILTKPLQLAIEKKAHTYFLHIRLGDYCDIDIYKIPLKNYYSKAIINIMESDINAHFLVFSNDNKNAELFIKKNILVPFDYKISESKTAYDTLVEMSSCCGAICTNSSLSWMGAYYQSEPRKNIYMPYPWLNSKVNTNDIYPEWASVIDLSK